MDAEETLRALEEELADMKRKLPSKKPHSPGAFAHADPIPLLLKIEELEDRIEQLKTDQKKSPENYKSQHDTS